MIQTTLVRVQVSLPSGGPASGATVTARLVAVGITEDSGFVDRTPVEAVTDAAGEASLPLWPSVAGTSNAKYRIVARSADGTKLFDEQIHVPESVDPVWLHDLVIPSATEPDSYYVRAYNLLQQNVLLVTEAQTESVAAATEAAGSASAAAGSASAAAASASAAEDAAAAAASAANAAAASETAAVGAANAAAASEAAAVGAASAAAASETAAVGAANAAAASEVAAVGAASAAAASETAAVGAANAAAASEVTAVGAASAAAASEIAAAASADEAEAAAAVAQGHAMGVSYGFVAVPVVSAEATVDLSAGAVQRVVLTDPDTNLFVIATGMVAGVARQTTLIVQQGTGANTISWPPSVRWPAGVPPVLSFEVGVEDVVTLLRCAGDSHYYGFFSGDSFHA